MRQRNRSESKIKRSLEELRQDYISVKGRPFNHFFCPMLYTDEDVELCKGHIVNQFFKNSSQKWTVQRKDVDAFYGSRFEADFADIQLNGKSLPEVLADRSRSQRIRPKIYVDNEPFEVFATTKGVPSQFTPLQFEGTSALFGLRMNPAAVQASEGKNWEIEISRDLRLPALVCAIKAAHLTLFYLLGYRYAFSLAGHFVGREILGKFFLENCTKSKPEVLANAPSFFREFFHMVRPLVSQGFNSRGSVQDRGFKMCIGSSGHPWALIVFVKAENHVLCVLVPILEQPEQAATFVEFLRNESSTIQIATCYLRNDKWEVSKERKQVVWPKDCTLLD